MFISVDCPQSNGLNERLNQTLVNRIRCKINSGRKQAWSKITKECVKEYNQTVHSSTKFEPAYLLYGKKSSISPVDTLNQDNIEEDRKIALINSIKNFETNKNRIDKNRKMYEFKVGDEVYVENGSKLNIMKIDKVRIGPYPILKKISSSFYEVGCAKRGKVSNQFHSSKLSPYFPNRVTSEV